MNYNLTRRSLFGSASAAALTLLGEMPALAAETTASTAGGHKQIPGVYHWAVGDMNVIAVSGAADFPR